MPIRLTTVIVGIFGLMLLGALVCFGADPQQAARTGPRWKRWLIGAALALLALVGAGSLLIRSTTTCYVPVRITSRDPDVRHLRDQLDLLWDMNSAGRLDPTVTLLVLDNIDRDVAILSAPGRLDNLPEREREEVKDWCGVARSQVQDVRRRIDREAAGGK